METAQKIFDFLGKNWPIIAPLLTWLIVDIIIRQAKGTEARGNVDFVLSAVGKLLQKKEQPPEPPKV